MSLLQPRLHLRLAQKQILTPGLVQMVSVLALNKLELRDMIFQEMVANPVLEELTESDTELDASQSGEDLAVEEQEQALGQAADREVLQSQATAKDPFEEIDFGTFFDEYLDPGYRSPAEEVVEKPSFENFLSKPANLTDHLLWQLSLSPASPEQKAAGESIIGNLDEDGYLTATLEEISQTGGHTLADVEEALRLVQEFDPLGVASRDLRECLLLQLRGVGMEGSCAWQVVSDHLKQVETKQFKEIAKALNRPVDAIEEAVEFIRRLDPRPGQRYNKVEARVVEPEVFFVKMGDEYQVRMNDDDLPQLRLNRSYRRLLERDAASKEVRNYIKERYSSAIQLIKNIEQRKQTILKVCQVIVRRQRDFLDRGPDVLKPMMIKEVAEEVGVHPSTVSRAVANKYAHTPQGVLELRNFFSESVNGPQGQSTSLLVLKRMVKKMIEEENPAHPLTDEQIMIRLHAQGINVTRRTVAKYREDMQIPSTHHRRVKAAPSDGAAS